jgi:hypothetical protein
MCRKVKSCAVDEMLVPVRVQTELVPAPALDQAREAADLARVMGLGRTSGWPAVGTSPSGIDPSLVEIISRGKRPESPLCWSRSAIAIPQ